MVLEDLLFYNEYEQFYLMNLSAVFRAKNRKREYMRLVVFALFLSIRVKESGHRRFNLQRRYMKIWKNSL